MSGFAGLDAYLAGLAGRTCTLSFARVEELTGFRLPPEARAESWWRERVEAAEGRSSDAADWCVETVWGEAGHVRFARASRGWAGRPGIGLPRPCGFGARAVSGETAARPFGTGQRGHFTCFEHR